MAALRPNVILICVDQWRGDALSIAGHPVVHTPYLDQLALDGVRFVNAFAASPTCIPARASLYTGLTPRTHGRVGYRDGVPWDYPVTLGGEFTRNGYQTQAIGKMHVYPERSQMGFQNVILHDGYVGFSRREQAAWEQVDDYLPWLEQQLGRRADYAEHGLNCNSYVARPWDKPEHVHPTNYVVTQAVDFLRRRDPRKPFFLFLSFHRPHPPYDPPAWAFEQYLNATMPDVPVGDWVDLFDDFDDPRRPDCMRGEIEPWLLQRARAGYYGHMTHIDHQINRFLEVLYSRGLAETTWICFVSDHGEMMGDHHLFRKAYPYQGSVQVPLILRGPPGAIPKRGAALGPLVELRDVMPTLLECAGLAVPPTVEGRSLLPLIRGQDVEWRPFLQGEHTFFGTSWQSLTDGREKYIWWSKSGREQLFDLVRDPQERSDLAGSAVSAGRLEHWRSRLIAELEGREEGFTDGKRLIPGRPVSQCLSHVLRGSS